MCFLVQKRSEIRKNLHYGAKTRWKNVQNRRKNGWKNAILGEMLLLAEAMYGGQAPAAFAH